MRGIHYARVVAVARASVEWIDDARYLKSNVSLIAEVHARRVCDFPKDKKLKDTYFNTKKFLGKN